MLAGQMDCYHEALTIEQIVTKSWDNGASMVIAIHCLSLSVARALLSTNGQN